MHFHAGFIWLQHRRRGDAICQPGSTWNPCTLFLFFFVFGKRFWLLCIVTGEVCMWFSGGRERWKQKADARHRWGFLLSLLFSPKRRRLAVYLTWFWFGVHRLRRVVQGQVQPTLKAQRVRKGLRDVLCEVQMRATRHLRQQRTLRQMLHWHDHPWQQDQVPLNPPFPPPSVSSNWVAFLLLSSFNSVLMLSPVFSPVFFMVYMFELQCIYLPMFPWALNLYNKLHGFNFTKR